MRHSNKLRMHAPTAPSDRAKKKTGAGFNGYRISRKVRRGKRGGRY